MSIKEIVRDTFLRFNPNGFQKHVESHCLNGFKQFKKIIHSYILFHLSFIGLLLLETTLFLFLLSFSPSSSLIAFSVAGVILTAFIYLIFLFYFQTRKPEQFFHLRNWYMKLCKKELPHNIKHSEYHLSLANAAYKFASHLGKQEIDLYKLPQKMGSINQLIKKFTNLYHRKDLHKMKEILLTVSINEHIQLIKKMPTNVEVHASLANTYIALSHLHQNTSQGEIPAKGSNEKFKTAIEKATQEFKIINHYTPNDPWVHAQLGSCYHELGQYEEEIQEYEAILKLCPNDKEIIFRLGILYFQQGNNAKGLQLYEELNKLNFSRADELIELYDANVTYDSYTGTSLQ